MILWVYVTTSVQNKLLTAEDLEVGADMRCHSYIWFTAARLFNCSRKILKVKGQVSTCHSLEHRDFPAFTAWHQSHAVEEQLFCYPGAQPRLFPKYLLLRELPEPPPKAVQHRVFPVKEGDALCSLGCAHCGGHLRHECGVWCLLFLKVKVGKRKGNFFLCALLVSLSILRLSSVSRKVLPQRRY